MHRGYEQQIHICMDKRVTIFMKFYNVTDSCYTLQLYYEVSFRIS